MRTDRRYTRTRDMLLDEAVPRLPSGGIALCHICQRSVYFAGGFLELLLKRLERAAKDTFAPCACPRCGNRKLYAIARYRRQRCAACRHEWSATAGTERHYGKKPKAWYAKIAELYERGLNPHQIAKHVGSEPKAIYAFLRRREVQKSLNIHKHGE